MLSRQLFGPGGNTTPEYWIDGRRVRAASKAPSAEKAVPFPALSVDPSHYLVLLRPTFEAERSAIQQRQQIQPKEDKKG